ncbi:MAG: hypothetical protein AABY22_19985 [Nanoarchaeota archaeon]
MNKQNWVSFGDAKIEDSYNKLKNGKFEEKQLYNFITRAIGDIKSNPFCGARIANQLIPKDYIKKYTINNLWKYNLPNSWRLVYSLKGNQIEIVSMILEWFNHKDYEKRINY